MYREHHIRWKLGRVKTLIISIQDERPLSCIDSKQVQKHHTSEETLHGNKYALTAVGDKSRAYPRHHNAMTGDRLQSHLKLVVHPPHLSPMLLSWKPKVFCRSVMLRNRRMQSVVMRQGLVRQRFGKRPPESSPSDQLVDVSLGLLTCLIQHLKWQKFISTHKLFFITNTDKIRLCGQHVRSMVEMKKIPQWR